MLSASASGFDKGFESLQCPSFSTIFCCCRSEYQHCQVGGAAASGYEGSFVALFALRLQGDMQVTILHTYRLLLIGLGIVQDDRTVKSVSRSGDR